MANPVTIALAAYDAGLRSPEQLAQATAIALAESGGNERAHNAVAPDDSYGLWQINMYGELGPARRTQFGIASNDALYDIGTNARAMAAISSNGTNWGPWSTYKGTRYWFFYPAALGAASAALAARGAGQVADAAGAAVEPVTDVASSAVEAAVGLKKAAAWLSDRRNWFRVSKVVVGGLLVVNGAAVLAGVAGYGGYSKITGAIARPILNGLTGKGKQQ